MEYFLTLYLTDKFRGFGKDKTLGSFTLDDIDELAADIAQFIEKKKLELDEPPF